MGTDPTMWLFVVIFVGFVGIFAMAAYMDRGKDSDVYPDYHPENYNDVTSGFDEWEGN